MRHKLLLLTAIIMMTATIMLPPAMIQAHAAAADTKLCIIADNPYSADDTATYRTSVESLDNYAKIAAKLPKIKRDHVIKTAAPSNRMIKTACSFTPDDFKKERTGNTYTTKYDNTGEDDSALIII